MKLEEGFSGRCTLLPNDGRRLEEKDWLYELHKNNFIILLSAEKKRKDRQAKSNLFPLQRTVESPIQTDHRGYASQNMQPIHSGKIASGLQRQGYKVYINKASITLKQRASEGEFLHFLHFELG